MNPLPVILEGTLVRLEPLGLWHKSDLRAAGASPEIFDYLPFGPFETERDLDDWLDRCLKQVESGERVWYAIVRRSDQRAVGATSYMDIRRHDRGLEIGGTWLATEVWRTAVNTESKYLLLRHAFETLGCLRVQLKTDLRNVHSQRAIERLGALREGVLRQHMVVRNGFVRDTVMYSILDGEWPAVRSALEARLQNDSRRERV